MADHDNGYHAVGQRAQQQLRDLGHAVRQAARELHQSDPNSARGDQIIRGYQQQTRQIVQSGRQPSNHSIGVARSRSSRAAASTGWHVLGALLLLGIALGLLLLFYYVVALFTPLWLSLLIGFGTNFVLLWFLTGDSMVGTMGCLGGLIGYIVYSLMM